MTLNKVAKNVFVKLAFKTFLLMYQKAFSDHSVYTAYGLQRDNPPAWEFITILFLVKKRVGTYKKRSVFSENWRSIYTFRELYDIKNYDPRDRDDHFCPECQIGRDILKANPDLAELASRWQFEGDEYQVRFDLLAKYLVEKGSSFDDHFTGQADSCGICHIDYKYIIK